MSDTNVFQEIGSCCCASQRIRYGRPKRLHLTNACDSEYSTSLAICLISSISISAEKTLHDGFLASLYAIARLSSVTFVHPTQTIEIFGNVSTPFNTVDIRVKFYGDRPRGTPPSGELNTRGVAEYSDFRPIKRYISETVHDLS